MVVRVYGKSFSKALNTSMYLHALNKARKGLGSTLEFLVEQQVFEHSSISYTTNA